MRKRHSIVIGQRRGIILLPDASVELCLTPVEQTLYRLFLNHPEGIPSDNLLGYWHELCAIYAEVTHFDDLSLRADTMESLCSESKNIFYSNISRIKRKFVSVLGRRKAESYIIKRDKSGLYRTHARKK